MVREVVGRWSVLAGVLVLVISIAATTGARAPAAAIATTDDRACAEIIESLRDGKTSSGSSQILGRSAPRLKQVCPAVLPGSPDWHACRWRHIGRPALDRLDTCLERTAIARDEIARRCLGHAKGKLLAREAPAKEVEAELIALGRQAGDDVAHYWRARRIASGDPGSALDPRGEVSAGGYFAYLKLRAEQKEWSGPYYLGFAERFPYVVQPRSRVPAFDGERLQFEVEAREVDPASITFPPVRLRTRRLQRDLYLSYRIDDLTRDGDRDGLSDLYEEKILTDPASPDSDGDGIADGSDLLPLTPNTAVAGDEERLLLEALGPLAFRGATALVEPVRGPASTERAQPVHDRLDWNRVLFIVSPRPLFQGSALPLRTIVVTPEILQAYEKKFGPSYMLEIGTVVFSPERDRAYFDYSFRWRGGAFRATRTPQGWQLTRVQEWIT